MTELADYLTPQRVVPLQSVTKVDALKELIGVLVAFDGGIAPEGLSREIWKREDLMSTGIGNGLAIPHVRIAGVKSPAMAVGVTPLGIRDYASLDKKPVHIIVMIVAPIGAHEIYIRLLSKVTDVLKEEPLRAAVIGAQRPEEIHRILTEGKL